MSFYAITTDPAKPVVTLDEAVCFLSVNTEDDNDFIKALVSSANDSGQKYTNRTFVPTAFEGLFDCLETSKYEALPFLTIERAPLIDVVSVEVFTSGAFATVSTDDYQIKQSNGFSRLMFTTTPTPDADIVQPFKVTFNAGYGAVAGDASKVPDEIKTAVKQQVAFWYENRGDVMPEGEEGIPVEAKFIYRQFRILNTF